MNEVLRSAKASQGIACVIAIWIPATGDQQAAQQRVQSCVERLILLARLVS